jgi:hypothetical protein
VLLPSQVSNLVTGITLAAGPEENARNTGLGVAAGYVPKTALIPASRPSDD